MPGIELEKYVAGGLAGASPSMTAQPLTICKKKNHDPFPQVVSADKAVEKDRDFVVAEKVSVFVEAFFLEFKDHAESNHVLALDPTVRVIRFIALLMFPEQSALPVEARPQGHGSSSQGLLAALGWFLACQLKRG